MAYLAGSRPYWFAVKLRLECPVLPMLPGILDELESMLLVVFDEEPVDERPLLYQ